MNGKPPRLFTTLLAILLLTPFIAQAQGSENQRLLAQSSTSQNSLFGGIGDATRSFFEGVQQQFNDWFSGGPFTPQGGAEIPRPTTATPSPGLSPTPPPYLSLGDLIQLDSDFSANCIPDVPPDELHQPGDRDTQCDWEMASASGPDFPNMYEECDGHWRTAAITCLTDYEGNPGYQPSNPQGCAGQSTIETCLLQITADGYQMQWRLNLDGDRICTHQNGERAGDFLLGRGALTETTFFGVHPDEGGGLSVGYWWPSGRYLDGTTCGHYENCSWGSDGYCECGVFCDDLRPYNFISGADDDAQASIAFQAKPGGDLDCCDGLLEGCTWENGLFEGAPSEYTAISGWTLGDAVDITGLIPTPSPTPESTIPCIPPPESMAGCGQEDPPPSVDGWLSSGCQFPPDWDDVCLGTSPAPDPYFKQCPLDTYTVSPRDLCWGLYDPVSSYAPSQVLSCTGGLTPEERQSAENASGTHQWPYTCRYQVPSANILSWVGEECNKAEHLGDHYRMCSPIYAPASTEGIGIFWNSYLRKLNGCNHYFEGEPIFDSSTIGLPGDEPPGFHVGYCNDMAPVERQICNTTDGMRCVNRDGPNVCRKAIRVETFEESHRTRTPPPGGAFTANCLIRETEGSNLNCGSGANCGAACPYSPSPCPDGTAECCNCTQDVHTFEYHCDIPYSDVGHNCPDGSPCCYPCDESNFSGCERLQEELDDCDYPVLGSCDTSLGSPPTDPLCDGNGGGCAELDDCCKQKEHCAFPMPPSGIYNMPDSDANSARNCAVYEWTERENIYTVEYESNAITLTLDIKNLSSHPVPAVPFSEDDPNSIIKFSVNIPDFLDYKETRLILSDERADRDTEKDPIYLPDLSTTPLPNTHGGRVELIFTPLPAAYDTENGNSEITLLITVIPAIVGPDGNDHFADFEITDLSELDWYINQLPSDDRLANLEFNAQWANTRSVDLLSFWIGQGVLSTQNPPCKYDTAPCFTDAEALPYGWPNLGVVSQDWGGIEDINAEDTVVWSNPLADIYGPRYETLEQEGAYLNCGTEIDPEWINAGIDITPPGGTTWSPEVFSTHAGHVTHVGESPDYDNDGAPDYPGRGYYVEIQSTTDDDCQPNFLTRYANLAHGSIRVGVGEYVPRHKLLGLMGDSGTPGYVHLHYTIREGNPQQDPDLADIPDNNVGLWHPQNVDADIDPPFPNYLDWQEPDDVRQPYYADSCDENPYRCNTGSPGELTSTPAELDLYGSCAGEYPPRFFCTVRRREDEIRSCYYANP